MRTIHREIVGGFIISKDQKVLLGKNRKGGVYEGEYVVPGGGVEVGETHEVALRREMLEETGIDIAQATTEYIRTATGEHEKTLRDIGERVLVKMNFHDYRIELPLDAKDVEITAEDDWMEPRWFTPDELTQATLSSPTRSGLIETKLLQVHSSTQ